MPPGPSLRVLLFHPERLAPRAAIDWIADRQAHSRVIVPPLLRERGSLPPRALHEPFAPPAADAARLAAEVGAVLAPDGGPGRAVAEAAALALVENAAVVAADAALFRDLVPFSSWSMNLPARPTDGLLAQHLGIASRVPAAWSDAARDALEAVLWGEAPRLARAARDRRLRARRDGPVRFRRLAKTSSGLRPGVVYLDLLAAPAAAGPGFADLLRSLDRPRALALVSMAAALFV